ncbi:MAG TPA: YihY/virulence factor BrkB family protein [Acidobacteriota bacterium]|nr:YihY/virulence factor BrkB family protein [Acidobacteriota bacterium]
MASWSHFLGDVTRTQFLKDLYAEIQDDNVFNGAAALAYYWMLAIFPALIFLLSLLPFLPIPNLEDAIMDFMGEALPQEAAGLFSNVLSQTVESSSGGLLSFGLLFTLWSASAGLYAIMQQLNITYDIKEGRSFVKARGVSILLTLGFLLMIIGAFALIVFGGTLQEWLASFVGRNPVLLAFFASLRWIIIIALLLLGFSMIYYFGPNVEQKFKFITPGSVLGVALLVAASLGFSFYVSNFGNYAATYGSLGAVIILLLWLYLAGFVILVGSEINALLEHYNPEGKQKGDKFERA